MLKIISVITAHRFVFVLLSPVTDQAHECLAQGHSDKEPKVSSEEAID